MKNYVGKRFICSRGRTFEIRSQYVANNNTMFLDDGEIGISLWYVAENRSGNTMFPLKRLLKNIEEGKKHPHLRVTKWVGVVEPIRRLTKHKL